MVEINLYEELDWTALDNEYNSCCTLELSDNPNPDWADLLAKDWLDSLKGIYKEKDIPKNKIVDTIVKKQGTEFSNVIDTVFDDVDFESPDYILREKLKQNVWRFSAAKNYNDLIRLNNLLIRDDGSLRNWSEFKREAQKVVGNSVRYLKTEYNTIVASAQMARLWAEIQRDKHIFPYVQFIVVRDNHTSEICTPLHNVIVSVDDPMLLMYFPPNHFNCRTIVKKLRRGVPTVNWTKPNIPDAFKKNPAIDGKVFSDQNSYIENTPRDVKLIAQSIYLKRLKEAFKDATPEVKKQLEIFIKKLNKV